MNINPYGLPIIRGGGKTYAYVRIGEGGMKMYGVQQGREFFVYVIYGWPLIAID